MREPEKVGATPILVGCDHRLKAIWAMAVNMKGPIDSAVKWLTGKIDQAAGGMLRGQGSPQVRPRKCIIALKKAFAIKRQAPTGNIESPVRDSQANGNAERFCTTTPPKTYVFILLLVFLYFFNTFSILFNTFLYFA